MQKKTFSLMISNYPNPAPVKPGQPDHKIKILEGEQPNSYFVGEYALCVEKADAFMDDHQRWLDDSIPEAL